MADYDRTFGKNGVKASFIWSMDRWKNRGKCNVYSYNDFILIEFGAIDAVDGAKAEAFRRTLDFSDSLPPAHPGAVHQSPGVGDVPVDRVVISADKGKGPRGLCLRRAQIDVGDRNDAVGISGNSLAVPRIATFAGNDIFQNQSLPADAIALAIVRGG